MLPVTLNRDEGVAVLVNDLADSLHREDPQAARDAAETIRVSLAKGGEAPPSMERAYVLACAHLARCRPPQTRCVGCALSEAIVWCIVGEDEPHVRELVLAIGVALHDFSTLQERLRPHVEKFVDAEAVIAKTRGDHVFASERPRRTVPRRIRRALDGPPRWLNAAAIVLLRDCVPGDMEWLPRPKGGARSKDVVNHVISILRDVGLGDAKIADLIGYSKDEVKRRRKARASQGG